MASPNLPDTNISILLVDDIPVVRRLLKGALSELGYSNLTEAENGAEALELLHEKEFQLVICDWQMPEMNGMELLTNVRADEKLMKIPFLICSSLSQREHVKEAAITGASNYLIKPFNKNTLCSKLEAIFKK